jgi:hypothetical protein
MKKIVSVLLCALCLVVFATPEMALAGGLDSGTQAATNFKVWFFSFLGVIAIVYLGWEGMQLWRHNAQWIDFGEAVAKVAAVGAVVGLGTWAWSVFA